MPSSPQPSTQAQVSAARIPRRKPAAPRRARQRASKLLTSTTSPLAQADLRSILSNPVAWTALDATDRAKILALFPDRQHVIESGPDSRPNFATLMNDDSFRYDCAAYTTNLAAGRHDEEWLADAWAAHERRKAGDFDAYLDNKFADEWLARPESESSQSPA
ncbi:hypothetical protein L249_5707 [Ophiocordyceps polyrhachis-furcata BCC 54312]|uniref:ASX DEUBAD domain-containing protein n=1 Tax=Ophiocordyceps polyrhachis-furcata BCC 54312 TaxID=1330021 RepID=A0A367L047_9HYPO|nr:hypothetical protein L249_5707 [Ophiocordyceps polyrhachis-furcata BCC 54312]